MDKWIGAVVAIVVVAVVVWLGYRAWRRRVVRDETLSAYPLPASIGPVRYETEVLYVATTPVGSPLERLAVEGLAFRGSGRVEVLAEGLVLRIAGERPSFVPADRLVAAGEATYAIDRGVEPGGLVAISWIVNLDEPAPDRVAPYVDSYLRARHPGDSARIIDAVNDIAAARPVLQPHQESEASDD
ncbi:hypothetical protein [Agromyces salentinus]|uniref:PH domain-containing protein n=1 Tax=Agromyces salentinus TaxID=269421 RepID=A0ABN2MXY9_9MICO|nr:hypothetical protein [Agromyces salentinus]